MFYTFPDVLADAWDEDGTSAYSSDIRSSELILSSLWKVEKQDEFKSHWLVKYMLACSGFMFMVLII